jgi:hypothetical protein
MSETDMIVVGDPLPKLASVEPANGPTSVSVVWASGSRAGMTEIIDLAPMIYTFKVFRPLRDDPALFRTVRLGEWGASIVWEGHDDLDIGADALEELACEQMTPTDFQAFMKRHGFSYDATAAALGISRRLVAYYARERIVPRTVALACKYIDLTKAGRSDMTPQQLEPVSTETRVWKAAAGPLHERYRDSSSGAFTSERSSYSSSGANLRTGTSVSSTFSPDIARTEEKSRSK